LLGDPYALFPDMPDIAGDAYPVAYGDWREAYLVVDRRQITTLRDPLTQATTGMVRFLAAMRDGGLVVHAEAIKKQKIA
jgi:HK97 family phage major capsid protein